MLTVEERQELIEELTAMETAVRAATEANPLDRALHAVTVLEQTRQRINACINRLTDWGEVTP